MISETSVVLRITNLESRKVLEPMAEKYKWPIHIGGDPIPKGFALEFENETLQLRDLAQPKLKPLIVDFLSETLTYRRKHGLSKTQVFAKAIGVTARGGLTVLDTTAGMGVDSFFLACLDCKTTAIERSPVVFELLQDGLRRARADKEIGPWIDDYLQFVHANAIDFMNALKEKPQVVYVDPMFPDMDERSALPKKEMQIFRKLLGADLDTKLLFDTALRTASDRVVVKRPSEASPMAEPTHSFEGKTARYDLYKISRKT
jgi:16S rRNA (guanine1516-N2)-methyltransferase